MMGTSSPSLIGYSEEEKRWRYETIRYFYSSP